MDVTAAAKTVPRFRFRYLPYALGGGYVLSSDLVSFIASNSARLQLYGSEDVSVGVWLAPLARLNRVHDERFDTEFVSRGCLDSYLVTHKQSVEEIRTKQYSIVATGTFTPEKSAAE